MVEDGATTLHPQLEVRACGGGGGASGTSSRTSTPTATDAAKQRVAVKQYPVGRDLYHVIAQIGSGVTSKVSIDGNNDAYNECMHSIHTHREREREIER